MKRFLTTFFITCLAAAAYAQNGKVTMTVVDSQTKEGVAGAVIEFKLSDGSADPKYYTSGFNGKADIAGLKSGEYDMTISFLGYDDLAKKITVTASTKDLGTFDLTQSTTKIETVVKEVQSIRTSQKGDTVSYNAEAFKVANDADMEGLLKKMPGITITNGTVEAQGETVQKIFVDGKEFFGEDVATALNSLPAQAVKSVEVYNKLSDNAEFSGMDDGEGYKAINIVTHETMRQGFFGKLYAGYGYQPETDEITNSNKYILGGNVNMFHGSSRVSLIGLLNNINQQNFSFEDILDVSGSTGGMGGGMGGGVGQYMVRPQSGVANVGSIGVNYSDSWGEDEKVKLQASYFFNRTRTRNLSQTTKWYEAPLEDLGTLEQEGRSAIYADATPPYVQLRNGWGGEHTTNDTRDYGISQAIEISNGEMDLGPDKSIPIRGVNDVVMKSYEYTYDKPGTYNIAFVAKNININGEKSVVLRKTITVEE